MGAEICSRPVGTAHDGTAPVFAFLRSCQELERPDIQFRVLPWSSGSPAEGIHRLPGFSISICPIRPESRGEVRLSSPGPLVAPSILASCLATERDRRTTVAGLHRAQEICAFEPVKGQVEAELWPGPELAAQGDEALVEGIKDRVTTIFHPVSLVSAGAGAQLDERCHVWGVRGSRVADASVMPAIVSGNTSAAANMISERASGMIIEDARAGARTAALSCIVNVSMRRRNASTPPGLRPWRAVNGCCAGSGLPPDAVPKPQRPEFPESRSR